ncbi:hypothetical protein CU304_05810 [Prochlorococcus marinus str. MU1415]|nr:hypothetical protein [Prochlorococcus marinus str. MU1415]
MKLFLVSMLIFSLFDPIFSEENKKYKKEDFEKIKIMKIEYLNKKLICVNNSQNFRQLKKCWKKKKQKIN